MSSTSTDHKPAAKPLAKAAAVLRRLELHIKHSNFAQKLGFHSLLGRMAVDKLSVLDVPGPFVSYLASVLADAIRRELLQEVKTFTFETVMSSRDKADFMREARERGYRVYLYFVATDDPDINLNRVQRRVLQGGHLVPEDKVRKRYRESIDLMTEASSVAYRTYIFDNAGSKHKLLVDVKEWASEVSITLHTSRLNPQPPPRSRPAARNSACGSISFRHPPKHFQHPSLTLLSSPTKGAVMTITCFIRYEIDPFKKDQFTAYAENWAHIIPRLGGHLLGYFAPHEGSNYEAWGLISFASLAAYEAYRQRLRADAEAAANFAFAKQERFILKEERTFPQPVRGSYLQTPTGYLETA